jgi:hypothetical protein
MRKQSTLALSLLGALASFGIAAAASVPTPTPDITPDWSLMRFELGTWNCSKTGYPARPGTSRQTVVNTMALDNHWMLTHSVSPPFDAARTKDSILDGYTGYERASHLWIFFGATNFGFWNLQTSPGWQGDTITWSVYDTSKGQPSIVGREVLTKLSDTETHNSLQRLGADGVWGSEIVQVCKKS